MTAVAEVVVIRTASLPADGGQLLQLMEAHASFEGADIVTDPLLERLAQLIADGRLRIWVASRGAELVGYVSLTVDVATWSGLPFAHMDCLFVTDRERNDGVGLRLLHTAAAAAAAEGLPRMEWQTPIENVSAARFYRRLGACGKDKTRFSLDLTTSLAP
jgi:GNAT superfamily N-acetyltransferase